DRISIGCPDAATARALLDALELGADQRRFEMRLVSVAAEKLPPTIADVCITAGSGTALVAAMIALAVMRRAPLLLSAAVAALFAIALVLASVLSPRKAVIGTDGIAVVGLAKRAFIPYSAVRAVRVDERGVVLERLGKASLLLPTVSHRGRAP